jgi:hypothetical protein
VLWVLGNSEGSDEIFWLALQAPAINKQALGRIVAASERERVFISAPTQFGRAAVHDAFRRSFQIRNWIAREARPKYYAHASDIRWRWR